MSLRARLLISAALTLAFCQCATPIPTEARPLATGEALAVAYHAGGTTFLLRNRSAVDVESTYSSGAEPSLKVADDETLNKLLEGFGRTQFFEHASESAPSQAQGAISVMREGRRYVYAQLPARLTSPERFEDFERCATLFRFVFNNTRAYHSADLDHGDFYDEKNRRQRLPQSGSMQFRGRK